MVFEDVPSTTMSHATLVGSSVAAAAFAAGLASSKGEAGRLIKQGGVYLNGERVTDDRRLLTVDDTIGGRLVVFQKGQRERRLVRIEGA
jgi:tyrosyl-tRNA synthetase